MPAMSTLAGNNAAKMPGPLSNGFDPHAEVFLEIRRRQARLQRKETIVQRLRHAGISLGPVGCASRSAGTSNTANSAADPPFFAGIKAKLFGVVPARAAESHRVRPGKFRRCVAGVEPGVRSRKTSSACSRWPSISRRSAEPPTRRSGRRERAQSDRNGCGHVLDGIGDLFDGTDPAPPLSDRVDAVGQLETLAGAIDAATLPSGPQRHRRTRAPRQDQVGGTGRQRRVDRARRRVSSSSAVCSSRGRDRASARSTSTVAVRRRDLPADPAQGRHLPARSSSTAVEPKRRRRRVRSHRARVVRVPPFQLRLIGDAPSSSSTSKIGSCSPRQKPDVNVVFKGTTASSSRGRCRSSTRSRRSSRSTGSATRPPRHHRGGSRRASISAPDALSRRVQPREHLAGSTCACRSSTSRSTSASSAREPVPSHGVAVRRRRFFGITITPESAKRAQPPVRVRRPCPRLRCEQEHRCMAGVYFRIEDGATLTVLPSAAKSTCSESPPASSCTSSDLRVLVGQGDRAPVGHRSRGVVPLVQRRISCGKVQGIEQRPGLRADRQAHRPATAPVGRYCRVRGPIGRTDGH